MVAVLQVVVAVKKIRDSRSVAKNRQKLKKIVGS